MNKDKADQVGQSGSLLADHTVLLDSGHHRDLLQGESLLGGIAIGCPWCAPSVLGDPHLVCWGAVQEEGQPHGPVPAPYLRFPVPGLRVSQSALPAVLVKMQSRVCITHPYRLTHSALSGRNQRNVLPTCHKQASSLNRYTQVYRLSLCQHTILTKHGQLGLTYARYASNRS